MSAKLNQTPFFNKRVDIPLEELEPVTCTNCQHEFKGHFCPNCGQQVAEFNQPFGFILYDFAGNFFAFDTRLFKTFKFLLLKPGFLAVEFFKGRRASYSPPFRTFVFLSFVLFVLLQSLTEKSLDGNTSFKLKSKHDYLVSEEISPNDINRKLKAELQLSGVGKTDLLNDEPISKSQSVDSLKESRLDFSIFASGSIRDNLNKLADQMEVKARQTNNPQLRKRYQTYITMCRAPQIVISDLMKYLSWMFFLLLPVYALLLKLFYIRRNQLYIRHLIFSIYLHSYLFFILILVTGLKLMSVPVLSYVSGVLLLTLPVYYIIALKRFYGQNYSKVILKFISVSLIYTVIISSAVSFILIKSLGIM
jgi:hypothetical protein